MVFFHKLLLGILYGFVSPFLLMSVVAVPLRFYTRRKLSQPLKLDDWLTLPSLVGVIALAVLYFYGIGSKALGYTNPQGGIDHGERITLTRRLNYSSIIIFAFVNGLIKISVLSLYGRIFVIVSHWKNHRSLFFRSMMTIVGTWAASFTVAFIFACGVDPEHMVERCSKGYTVSYWYAISDFISDILIVLVPIPFLWKLQLPLGRKFAVLGIFLLAIIASAASLTRVIWTTWDQHFTYADADEELRITSDNFWIMVEISFGLLASCLPTLRGLFRKIPKNPSESYALSSRGFASLSDKDSRRERDRDEE
ncbi:hypothetical protein P280DRAFT_511958 [Massarina eburnea CBS 473.64]|uniref:Rhodopsin domain-containing protein n=1 Tax=Massarina eburnea CBS 473.64 TaxID=1395130 RepID=A0A6A6RH38_9PLEO|nr:hypothetical protein P280DRAFT_511958 [Massarina eburnea CBS 473.64]